MVRLAEVQLQTWGRHVRNKGIDDTSPNTEPFSAEIIIRFASVGWTIQIIEICDKSHSLILYFYVYRYRQCALLAVLIYHGALDTN